MSSINFRKTKFRNLFTLYTAYFEAIGKDKRKWAHIRFETPTIPKLNFQRVLTVHVLNILLARLQAVAKTGSVLAFFETFWNPIILEVLKEDKLIGCVFLSRESLTVVQINGIAPIKSTQNDWVIFDVIVELKKYITKFGANRIIIRSIEDELKLVLTKSGFEAAFYDNVLYFDI
jgi:hypothetical protein